MYNVAFAISALRVGVTLEKVKGKRRQPKPEELHNFTGTLALFTPEEISDKETRLGVNTSLVKSYKLYLAGLPLAHQMQNRTNLEQLQNIKAALTKGLGHEPSENDPTYRMLTVAFQVEPLQESGLILTPAILPQETGRKGARPANAPPPSDYTDTIGGDDESEDKDSDKEQKPESESVPA